MRMNDCAYSSTTDLSLMTVETALRFPMTMELSRQKFGVISCGFCVPPKSVMEGC